MPRCVICAWLAPQPDAKPQPRLCRSLLTHAFAFADSPVESPDAFRRFLVALRVLPIGSYSVPSHARARLEGAAVRQEGCDHVLFLAIGLGGVQDAGRAARPFAWRDDQSRLTHHFFRSSGASRWSGWRPTTGAARCSPGGGPPRHTSKRDKTPWPPDGLEHLLHGQVAPRRAVELKWLKASPLASLTRKALAGEDGQERRMEGNGRLRRRPGVSLTCSAKLAERRRVWNVLAFMVGAPARVS